MPAVVYVTVAEPGVLPNSDAGAGGGGPGLRAELRTKGYRLTVQRQLVLEAVRELGHATPEQILTAVQRRVVAVNVSTVYRTLALLEELDLVRHTHLGHGASTFSLATEREHVHLVCRDCGAVQELPAEGVGDLAARLLEQQGFTVDIGHTALFGRCQACPGGAADPDLARSANRG